jgi:sugar phosphate isomerase/epimerase
MISRREAVKRLGAAVVGVAGASSLGRTPVLAAREVAGGLGPRGRKRIESVGVQLYTVRGEMQQGLATTLERVAAIGYEEVEFAGYFGFAPAEIRKMLADVGLRAPATHIPPAFEDDAWREILDDAAEAGHTYVVVPSIPEAMRSSLDAWRRTGEVMTRVAEQARGSGLRFGYHNHAVEFTEMEGRVPFDGFLEASDPGLVELELDLFWTIHGGADPVSLFKRWPGRVKMVHVKDRTATGDMVDVGAGVIDWAPLLAQARLGGVEHFFVEHDQPEDPMGSIEVSYRYLSGLQI